MYCLCQVLTFFMMFVFFWKCWAAILGSINREAEESGYRGSMWYSVKRYWQGMFTCQASLEWIYSVYMWIFIFYQARFWTSRCIRVCLLEEGFFLSESVRSLLLIRSSACESFNFLRILKSPFPKLPNNTIGHRTMESLRNPGMHPGCQSTSTTNTGTSHAATRAIATRHSFVMFP